MIRKLKTAKFFHFIFAGLLSLYMRFTFLTQRITYDNLAVIDELEQLDTPLIVCMWHGRLILGSYLITHFPSRQVKTIISRHNDGDMIARYCKFFGSDAIRGSSNKKGKNKGGAHVLRELLTHLNNETLIAITPDGPRGPRMQMQGNILPIAARKNATLLPVSYSCSRAKIFNSWDRFLLPLPFGKMHIVFGTPHPLTPAHDDQMLENTRNGIENQLNMITHQADMVVGRPPIMPQ